MYDFHTPKKNYIVFFSRKKRIGGYFVSLQILCHQFIRHYLEQCQPLLQYVVYEHLAFNAIPTQVMLKYFSWHITYHAIAIIPTPIVLHFEEMKEQQCTVCDFEFFLTNFIASQYNIIYDIELYIGWILLNVETMPKILHYFETFIK